MRKASGVGWGGRERSIHQCSPESWFAYEMMAPGLQCLNRCFPVFGTVWKIIEALRGRAILEEGHLWEWALKFYSLTSLPVLALYFLCGDEMWPLCFLLSVWTSHSCCHTFPHLDELYIWLELRPNKLFAPESCVLGQIFYHTNRNVIKTCQS